MSYESDTMTTSDEVAPDYYQPPRMTSLWLVSEVNRLSHAMALIKNAVEDMQRKLDAMWDAPGMPGAESTLAEFETDIAHRLATLTNNT